MDTRIPDSADRDFVAGAFVVRDERILFLKHRKYGVWLQPGGHVEERETPDEAAIREVKEETGLEVEIVDDFQPGMEFGNRAENLPQPVNVNVHRVEEGHWHVDFLYVARIKDEVEDYEYDEGEMKWFSEEELEKDLEMPDNARKVALKVLEEV